MNTEFQRLQDAIRDVEREIRRLQENALIGTAAELAALERERERDKLSVRLSSLTKAMILLRSTGSQELREQQRDFVGSLPHKYHSQGLRRKVIRLPGGVQVTLNVRYFHRQKEASKVLSKPQRGMFPALILLRGPTPSHPACGDGWRRLRPCWDRTPRRWTCPRTVALKSP